MRRGELTVKDGQQLASDISGIAVETVPTRGLMIDAQALAITTGLTVYDAMYLALAVRLEDRVDHRRRQTRSDRRCASHDRRARPFGPDVPMTRLTTGC